MKHGSKGLRKKSKNIQNTLGTIEHCMTSALSTVKKKLKRRKPYR